ncbi:hypothetical protein [Mycolicibacterium mucogenicum]|nr:hypothetical protein [Mycolicibacterium mucogenicum]
MAGTLVVVAGSVDVAGPVAAAGCGWLVGPVVAGAVVPVVVPLSVC